MKIAFIGGGNMGEAIIAALLEKKRVIATAVSVSDVSAARRTYLADKYGVLTTDESLQAIAGTDIIVLAVKPQQFPEALGAIRGQVRPDQLVISIAAGVTMAAIAAGLDGHKDIVRAMPNMPAQIGLGVTGWTAMAEVSAEHKERARMILGAMGEEIFFAEEGMLDAVTAVSGSGPAYVFLFAEAMTIGAEKLGIPPAQAHQLVLQTLLGAAHLLETSGKPATELRQSVTSRGGTTERALQVMELGGYSTLVEDALKAAYERARELGT